MLSVWTQLELDVDMDAVAARETVTEMVTETKTETERDNAFVAFGLFGVCWWQRQTARISANALRCCKRFSVASDRKVHATH